jgi:transketolase
VIFATGSEVEIAVDAKALLEKAKIPVRVVSVPCAELFWQQSASYRARILGAEKIRVGVEAAVRQGWDSFIGTDGIFVGMAGFGASAPYEDLYKEFNITPQAIVKAVKKHAR